MVFVTAVMQHRLYNRLQRTESEKNKHKK